MNPRLPAGLSLADGVALAPRLADAGLHLQLQPSVGDIDRLGPLLDAVAVPVVLDHSGFPDLSRADGLRTRDTLLKLLEHDRLWLKLAAPYRFKVPMDDDRIGVYSRALTAARPDRMLWGSDWPHPEHDLTDADTRTIVASAPDWFADAEALRAACCLNPPELFA